MCGKVEDAKRREENLEEAKKITIEQDPTLPSAKTVIWVNMKLILNYTTFRLKYEMLVATMIIECSLKGGCIVYGGRERP